MLAPVKVVNPRVLNEQYPERDRRHRRKLTRRKPDTKHKHQSGEEDGHIDITA